MKKGYKCTEEHKANISKAKKGIKLSADHRKKLSESHKKSCLTGSASPLWKGGVTVNDKGYVFIHTPEHPRADGRSYVREHILVAEKALGKHLPKDAVVHHRDGDRSNNKESNLVICENQAHHLLIHQRQRALETCRHADWIKCPYCKEYDDPKNMYIRPNGKGGHHRKCVTEYQRKNNLTKGFQPSTQGE